MSRNLIGFAFLAACAVCAQAFAEASGEEKIEPWTGAMEPGSVYCAPVAWRNGLWWPEGLEIPRHHGVHVGWENLRSVRAIPKRPRSGARMVWTFQVLSKDVRAVPGRRQWRTTYRCRVLRAEAAGEE